MKTLQLLNAYLAKKLWNACFQFPVLYFVVMAGAVAVEIMLFV
jgi:hypothetical protein